MNEYDGALNYVREELKNIRSDLASLASELRQYTSEQGPKMAVLEHRLGSVEKDVSELQKTPLEDRKMRMGLYTSLTVSVLSWVPHLLSLITSN